MGTGTKGREVAVGRGQVEDVRSEEISEVKTPPRSLAIAAKGIKTAQDFAMMMSALMSDLIEGKITPNTSNATCNAGGKLLKIVDMQQRYGTDTNGGIKKLNLVTE